MLDENLPSKSSISCNKTGSLEDPYSASPLTLHQVFFIKPSPGDVRNQSTLFLSHHGSELEPAYTLRRPDPNLRSSKNCYALALFDSYNPDILFGEVLVRTKWTQPTLSAADLRRGETVPPPPTPIIPTDFVIQLYAPDQQVYVRQKPGSWGGSAYWEFELPQITFRQPSGSSLDRSRSDPAASETTPKLIFRWKRDGKLSKDLVCTLSGKSSNASENRKWNGQKEPDITVALFQHSKSITVYEPNLSRIEVEDLKGLELVLLLSAAVIKDTFFGNLREAFNITSPPKRPGSGESLERKPSPPIMSGAVGGLGPPRADPSQSRLSSNSNMTNATTSRPPNGPESRPKPVGERPPPADALTQWQIDAETTRLKAQAEVEQRAAAHAEHKERKRIKKMLEAEEREVRRRQAEVDRETERLKKVFREEQKEAERRAKAPQLPVRPAQPPFNRSYPPVNQSAQARPRSVPPPHSERQGTPYQQQLRQAPQRTPWLQPPIQPGSTENPRHSNGNTLRPEVRNGSHSRRSMFGLFERSEEAGRSISRKQSSVF